MGETLGLMTDKKLSRELAATIKNEETLTRQVATLARKLVNARSTLEIVGNRCANLHAESDRRVASL